MALVHHRRRRCGSTSLFRGGAHGPCVKWGDARSMVAFGRVWGLAGGFDSLPVHMQQCPHCPDACLATCLLFRFAQVCSFDVAGSQALGGSVLTKRTCLSREFRQWDSFLAGNSAVAEAYRRMKDPLNEGDPCEYCNARLTSNKWFKAARKGQVDVRVAFGSRFG